MKHKWVQSKQSILPTRKIRIASSGSAPTGRQMIAVSKQARGWHTSLSIIARQPRQRAFFKNLRVKNMENFVYLLDSDTATFRAAELCDRNSIAAISDLIGSDLIQMIRFDDMHSLFVDEEGLRAGLTSFTIFDGYPTPLAGKIALLGGDGSQPYCSPTITMTEAARRFQCCRPVFDPVFVPADQMGQKGLVVAGAVETLHARIDRRTPLLVRDGATMKFEIRETNRIALFTSVR
ncbi:MULTISPECIES: DUF3846 domain-containing protein [Rhizobium]|nr:MULTISPECIES: protein psiB [Rhizobium]MDQ0561081.1 hypothetical protein [Rhizobium mesoamericanum]